MTVASPAPIINVVDDTAARSPSDGINLPLHDDVALDFESENTGNHGDIALGDTPLEDIYGYMGALNTLEVGQKTTITIIRDGVEQTLELQL